jgi:hypothetical protein
MVADTSIRGRKKSRPAAVAIVAAAAAAAVQFGVGVGGLGADEARGDVLIGTDWTPTPNENGYTYFNGFTDYAGGAPTTKLQQVTRNGDNWLKYSNETGQYWGQLVGQGWSNPAISTANVNASPRLEFDLDLSEYTWGRLFLRVDLTNGAAAGQQTGTIQYDLSHLVAENKATLTAAPLNPHVQHVSVDLSSFTPREDPASFVDLAVFLQPNFHGYWDDALQSFISVPYEPQVFYVDNMRLTSDPLRVNAAWNANADGNWLTGLASNGTTSVWASGIPGAASSTIPNGAGHTANFYRVTNYETEQQTIGAHTVTVDGPVTIGVMNFNNASSYTIAGAGSGAITLQGVPGVVPPAINVVTGSHTIAAPLSLTADTTVNVADAASTLTLSNLNESTVTLTKHGAGTLAVSNVRAAGLNVASGTVQVTPDGTAAGASRVTGLVIGADGRLDLTNNKLITETPVGTFTGGGYSGVHGEVARAYHAGAWDRPGLMTSQPDAGPTVGTTTLGVASASQILFIAPTATGTWAGQPVTGTSTLVMYTYAGDLNFDGRVDAQDYGIIDNWVQFPGTSGYANGDINYDGVIDAADYGVIDNTIQLQGPPIPAGGAAGGLSGVTAVPESTLCGGLAIFAVGLVRRRRRQ